MRVAEDQGRRAGGLRPEGVSIYDRAFWRHERFWKVPSPRFPQMFNGTPFKNLVWRALGVRIGRRVFDDGCTIIEKKFTTIGDECTLNLGSLVQCHSQEDGGFKSDRSTVGARSTLGVGAFVHYGVTVGEDSVVLADSFLMKGEDVPPNSRWGGNPARELRDDELPARLSALAARADDHDYDDHHDDARDDDRTGPSDHTLEDLMAAFREDDAVNDDPNCQPDATPGRPIFQHTLDGGSLRRFGNPVKGSWNAWCLSCSSRALRSVTSRTTTQTASPSR